MGTLLTDRVNDLSRLPSVRTMSFALYSRWVFRLIDNDMFARFGLIKLVAEVESCARSRARKVHGVCAAVSALVASWMSLTALQLSRHQILDGVLWVDPVALFGVWLSDAPSASRLRDLGVALREIIGIIARWEARQDPFIDLAGSLSVGGRRCP